MKKKTPKGEWYHLPLDGAIKEVDMFDVNAKHVPITIFVHHPTGEIKQFSREYVDRLGINSILKALNK